MSNEDIDPSTAASDDESLEDIVGGTCKSSCACTRDCTFHTKVVKPDGTEAEDGSDEGY